MITSTIQKICAIMCLPPTGTEPGPQFNATECNGVNVLHFIKINLIYLLFVGLSRLLLGFVSTRCTGKTLLRLACGFPRVLWENSAA